MRQWRRAARTRQCGRCARPILKGEPLLTISLSGHRWKLVRCETCGGGAPPDLPRDRSGEPRADRIAVKGWHQMRALAKDWQR